MKEILIHSKKYGDKIVKVDDDDFDFVNQWKWHVYLDTQGKNFYVHRNDRSNGKHTVISMHRAIMKETDTKVKIDHKDHDGLNNCRSNLRRANSSQNGTNRSPRYKGASKFVGVTPNRQYWRSRITVNGKLKFIGVFKTEEEAARAYNVEAEKLHGEFACLNTFN